MEKYKLRSGYLNAVPSYWNIYGFFTYQYWKMAHQTCADSIDIGCAVPFVT